MDLRPTSENERFLFYFGAPYKGVLFCLTLKAAVMTIAIIDIVLSVLCALDLVFIFFKQSQVGWEFIITWEFQNILCVIAAYFAIKGIQGITKVDSLQIHLYSRFKTVELCILIPLRLAKYTIFCEDLVICGVVPSILGLIVANVVSFFFTKIVWSAYVRLSNNETLMVMHGKEVVEMMQQQPRVLSLQPLYAVPGQTIIQTPVGQAVRPVV